MVRGSLTIISTFTLNFKRELEIIRYPVHNISTKNRRDIFMIIFHNANYILLIPESHSIHTTN